MIDEKACATCKKTKPMSDFRMCNEADGHAYSCKECEKKYKREYYLKNKQRILEKSRKYRTENKEEYQAYKKDYYLKNKERILKYGKEYTEKNKEYVLARRRQTYKDNAEYEKAMSKKHREKHKQRYKDYKKAYYAKNREYLYKQTQEWIKNNPEKHKKSVDAWLLENKERLVAKRAEYYKENKERINNYSKDWMAKNKDKHRASARLYYAKRMEDEGFRIFSVLRGRVRAAISQHSGEKAFKTAELIGCGVPYLKKHLANQFYNREDGTEMAFKNYGIHGWHIDHIKPCSSFDLTDPEQQKQCFHYTNLQPLWAEHNLSKSDKLDWSKNGK